MLEFGQRGGCPWGEGDLFICGKQSRLIFHIFHLATESNYHYKDIHTIIAKVTVIVK
jgi:hypothetical protein